MGSNTIPNPLINGTGGILGTGSTPVVTPQNSGYTGVGQLFSYSGNDNNLDMGMWGPQTPGTGSLYNTSTPTSNPGLNFGPAPITTLSPNPNGSIPSIPAPNTGPISVADAVAKVGSGSTGSGFIDEQLNSNLTPTQQIALLGGVRPRPVLSVAQADDMSGKNQQLYDQNGQRTYQMGSNFTPISALNPNMSNGSLTGNPVYDSETLNNLSTLVPSGTSGGTFGSGGPTPINTLQNPVATPAGNSGVYRDTPTTSGTPTVGIPTPITQFGYNTTPGTATGATPIAATGTTAPIPGSAIAASLPTNVVTPELTQALDKTYGAGFGNALTQLLSQGAGYNQGVVNSFLTDIQPYFNDNLNQIMESFGASGQRFSSTAALAAGKFGADFTSHQQALMGQMYQWAYENYLGTLTKFANKNTSSNAFGDISNILGLVSTGADAVNAIGGVNNDTLQKVIDILGGL